MTLKALASLADLEARGIAASSDEAASALLSAASAAVREAAGCSITETTGTVTLFAPPSRSLTLPGFVIRSVLAVAINDEPVTDYKWAGNRLYRNAGWGSVGEPSVVTVTYTQGLKAAPADVVDLVCSLVAAGVARMDDGYNPHRGDSAEHIDDYQRSFTRGDDEVVSPMDLPDATIARLRGRFAGAAVVTGEAP